MHKHPRVEAVNSRSGGGTRMVNSAKTTTTGDVPPRGVNSAKTTSTGDVPPIQFIIHADPELIARCCNGQDGQNKIQSLEEFCRRCCCKYQDEPLAAQAEATQAQDRRHSSIRPQVVDYPTLEDFSMQTDECQTHFHRHLYNASLLQKYWGGNIFAPLESEDVLRVFGDEARSDSADELYVEERTDATQTDESEFPKVKLVRVLNDAETQTNESILSQLKTSRGTCHEDTMKQVNTSLTMIRTQNPFLYSFDESSSFDDILQPYCQCLSEPSSASPSMMQAPQQSLSNIYQLPPEKKKPKSESQKFMGCFKRKKSKEKTKNQ